LVGFTKRLVNLKMKLYEIIIVVGLVLIIIILEYLILKKTKDMQMEEYKKEGYWHKQ